MPPKKRLPGAPCPCGSGKKYQLCCAGKGFAWVEDEDGTACKSVPASLEVQQALQQLRWEFIARHGREPGADDFVFSGLPHPERLEAMVVKDMKAAGMAPAFIYAFEQTGLLVTEQNLHLIPAADLAVWEAAIEAYEVKRRQRRRRPRYPLGTVALYGPDDQTTTKIAAAVFKNKDAEPVIKRWVGTGVTDSARVRRQVQQFFARYGVQSVVVGEGNLGCVHEESLDFPVGGDCPFCPFWKGKQGSNRRE